MLNLRQNPREIDWSFGNVTELIAGRVPPKVQTPELCLVLRVIPAVDLTLYHLEQTRLVRLAQTAAYERLNAKSINISFPGEAIHPEVRPNKKEFLEVLQRRMYKSGFPEQTRFWLSQERKDDQYYIYMNPKKGIYFPNGLTLSVEIPQK